MSRPRLPPEKRKKRWTPEPHTWTCKGPTYNNNADLAAAKLESLGITRDEIMELVKGAKK
jgi:hypothetical protein